ncbi:methyltransferase domain-containing protein [Streptomyces sp. SRF1]|uniref:protein-L-isoaspartate O-methyltransferase family protein n=1 Tax=Streptomyces sp. SRF1 TaxID=1549642 RepID=UPI0025AF09B7|nr:methyltransferase domain-containing protein [Streptomyces sp. SRF1]MDN3058286.1 methyltransferase domain-containing protein [Streptomyces sp. SRF1]
MTVNPPQADRPSRKELGRFLLETQAMSSDWAPTFAAVDRAAFLPGLMWPFDMDAGTSVPVNRADDPDAWYAAADSNVPIVIQWDDGKHIGTKPGKVSTSSSSMPSVNYAMFQALAVDEGMRVLDVGTGTGETAGALAHRCGARNVTTKEVDRAVSRQARERLCRLGLYPDVVVGDGFDGHPDNAPYDRILATVGLREIPGAWIEQTRRGGLIVAPWGTHYSNADAVARLEVKGGTASGHFTRPVEFMKLRTQRLSIPGHGEYVPADALDNADTSTTEVTEAEFVTGKHTALSFALGLRVRDCVQAVADKREGARPVWFYSLSDRSWACVMFRDGAESRVWQSGPRRLWDEVEQAYRWWVGRDKPDHTRFGLTVTPDGRRAWLDVPAEMWAV